MHALSVDAFMDDLVRMTFWEYECHEGSLRCAGVHALHVDALVVNSISQMPVGTQVSQMVFEMRHCAWSSRRCLWEHGCHKWSFRCVIVHALHVAASVEYFMGQVTCSNTGVTNGLCDVLVRMLLV